MSQSHNVTRSQERAHRYDCSNVPKEIHMKKMFMIILISRRRDSAPKVQQLLTEWGCYIKIRLGIHDGVLNQCADGGHSDCA